MNTETVKTGTVSTGTITRLPGDTATQPLAAVPTQGQPPATPAAAAAKPPRADGVTLLAVYHFMLAGLLLLATMGLAIPTVITAIVEEREALGGAAPALRLSERHPVERRGLRDLEAEPAVARAHLHQRIAERRQVGPGVDQLPAGAWARA